MTPTRTPAFRFSVNMASYLACLRRLAGPAQRGLLLAAVMLMTAGTARAAGSSMPWEGPLESILESIQGPVARIVAVIIIIATGLALAFGDTSGGLSQVDPDRLRLEHRLRRVLVLPVLLLVLRRGRRMSTESDLPGFEVPLHRSLTEPILLGGAPRTVAIANGTLAAAVGLGLQLWLPGLALWLVGHALAVWGARVDPQFMQVFARHLKHKPLLDV